MKDLGGDFGLWSLIGRPVAFIPDARIDHMDARASVTEALLSISGGDHKEVQRKGLPNWSGVLPTRFVLTANEVPRLRDASSALANRMVPLLFEKSFLSQEDPYLFDKISSNRSGVMNWALDGLRSLLERGHFDLPASSLAAIKEIEEAFSGISSFLNERCIVEVGGSITFADLYAGYVTWCQEVEADFISAGIFSQRMAARGFRVQQPRDHSGHRQKRTYRGIRLA